MSTSAQAPPTPHQKSTRTLLLALVGLWLLLYASFTLFSPPLLDDADSVHAEAAREMLVSGDWVTLHANGIRYLEKAPLLYWTMAASFRLFGVGQTQARLPLALSSLALFLSTFVLGKRLFHSAPAGFYAALALETSIGIFLFTRILIPDEMLCLWLVLAMLFFVSSLDQPTRANALGFAASCALGMLTKGLIGVVFPLAIVVAFLWVTRNLVHLRRWYPLSGFGFFLAIAAPWHIAAGLANPTQGTPSLMPTQGNVHGFLWFYFFNEHVLRYLDQRIPRDYDTVPLALFWGLLLLWLMPWCLWALRSIAKLPWRSLLLRKALDQPTKIKLLLTLWAFVVVFFFSFSTRQEYYVLPALPALALLAGGWLAQSDRAPVTLSSLLFARVLMVVGWIAAGVSIFFVVRGAAPIPGHDISSLLSQNPQDYALSLGHFLDLSTAAMGYFRLPLALTAIAGITGGSAHAFLLAKGRPLAARCSLAAGLALFFVAAHLALVTFSPVISSEQLAQSMRPALQANDIVEINGEYESGSTLGFYLGRQVRILNGRSSNLWYGSFFPDAPPLFDDDSSFAIRWLGAKRIFLWTDKPITLPGPIYVLAESGGKKIISNQP